MNESEPNSLPALAGEFANLARREPDRLSERVAALTIRQQAELALLLPARQRLELLLHAPKPMRLVRALPDSELYLTVREVGPADSLRLISLASASQLHHLVDLESWRRDRFDADRSGAWIALLLEAGEPTIRRFLRNADDDLLALLFLRWMRVSAIELEEDPGKHGLGRTETGDEKGLVSPDGYHRLSPTIPEHANAVGRLVQIFFVDQPERYQQVLWAALYELPAEIEEKALRWRESRLEEHGYPPWDEALAVYAAPEGSSTRSGPPEPTDPDGLRAPRAALRILETGHPLAQTLRLLPDDQRDQALHELFAVGSRLMVADGADTGDPDAHQEVLRKAAGYIGIALEKRGGDHPGTLRDAVANVPLIELFREGHAEAVRLRQRAVEMRDEGWAAANPQAFRLLDPPLGGRMAGLLEPRPLYLEVKDEQGTGTLRAFRTYAEIDETRLALEMADAVGRLFVERMGLDLPRVQATGSAADHDLRFSTLILTLLAWHASRVDLRGEPLPEDVVADFLRTVASRRPAPPDAPARALDSLMKRLGEELGVPASEMPLIRSFGRASLERLAAECGGLDPGVPVDRRYVSCLLLA
jgi:hypothetical protein